MTDLPFAGTVGVKTFDNARYSAPPHAINAFEAFAGGLCVFELPRMEHVQAVQAPGEGGDVVIFIQEAMPRLDRQVASEMRARSIRPQTLVLIPEGLATDWYAPGGQPLCHHIHVPRTLRQAWSEEFGQGGLRPLVNGAAPEIERLFTLIAAELRPQYPFRRLRLQGLALAAAAACYRLSDNDGAQRAISRSMTPARLRRVRAYVEENLASEVCIEDMAACVGLSPAHFSRAFRAEIGMSPYAWVVQARIERVKDQLLNTQKALADIALQCGFASQSHMTETFRRATGLPPGRWRRERIA